MANQQANVYRCTVFLKSHAQTGRHDGDEVAIIAATPSDVPAIVAAVFGDDLATVSGPTLAVEGAWIGSPSKAAPAPAAKEKEETPKHGHSAQAEDEEEESHKHKTTARVR